MTLGPIPTTQTVLSEDEQQLCRWIAEQARTGTGRVHYTDAQTALGYFAEALGALQPSDPGYERARMGEIDAKIRLTPSAATQSFLAYAQEQPDQVDAGDYHKVGVQLSERSAFTDAVVVLDAGLKRFPDDPKLTEAMDRTSAAAQEAGDSSALDKLKGLGYVGGG